MTSRPCRRSLAFTLSNARATDGRTPRGICRQIARIAQPHCRSAAHNRQQDVEAARQDKVVCERFKEGFEQLAALMERGLGASPVKAENRQRALAMMAAMIGGVAASRAVAKADPKLSNEILRAVRRIVGEIGGEERQVNGARGRARATRKRARGLRAAVRTQPS